MFQLGYISHNTTVGGTVYICMFSVGYISRRMGSSRGKSSRRKSSRHTEPAPCWKLYLHVFTRVYLLVRLGTLRRGVDARPRTPTHSSLLRHRIQALVLHDMPDIACVCTTRDDWCVHFHLFLCDVHTMSPNNTLITKSKFWYSMSYTRAANMSTTPDVWYAPFPPLLCAVHAQNLTKCVDTQSKLWYSMSYTRPANMCTPPNDWCDLARHHVLFGP